MISSPPIFVEEVPVAQVGDSSAANGGDARQLITVERRTEDGVNPVHTAFERGALVRWYRGKRATASISASGSAPQRRNSEHCAPADRRNCGR